jgi:hypothetical protein
MSMKRRDFLTLSGLALGSILIPSQVARLIRETCVENEKPLLITPRSPRGILYAVDDCGSYTFHRGDPYKEPDPPTWEEYLDMNGVQTIDPESVKEYFRDQVGCEPGEEPEITLTDPIDGYIFELWLDGDYSMQSSSMALGYHYLQGLPLCPERKKVPGDALGSLSFIEGPHPGSNLTYVQAPDYSTVACLQHRLNELGEGVEIRFYDN